jgi:hypothetical protein
MLLTLEAGRVRGRDLATLPDPATTASIEAGRVMLRERRRGRRRTTALDLGPALAPAEGLFGIGPGGALHEQEDGLRAMGAGGRFALVACDTVRLITRLLSQDWVDAAGPTLVARTEIAWRVGGGLRIAGRDVTLAELEQAASVQPADAGASVPDDIVLRCDGWRIRRLAAYRPLIYLVAFGAPAVFESARLAIGALFAHGAYGGDVLLVTDTAHAGFAVTLPKALRDRVGVAVVEAADMLDILLARYRLPELAVADRYQPILYLDTDVLVDRPIAPFLLSLPFSDRLHMASEGACLLTGAEDYHGRTLCEADPFRRMRRQPGFNSGIIGFANSRSVRRSFADIVQASHAYAASAERRMFFPAADQCMANYVLRRQGRVSGARLTRLVTFAPPASAAATRPEPRRRTGFMHFCGGVGNAAPKLAAMRRYLRALCDPGFS